MSSFDFIDCLQLYNFGHYLISIDLWIYIIVITFVLLTYCSLIVLTFNDRVVDLSHTKVSQSETQDTDLPPHYPNSWIPVLESRNIRVNEMKTFTVFGQELVAYRSQSGRVSVLDAYCPHLGANIGVGGMAVKECGEECIRCPFHGWTFRVTDGLCVKIPQLNKCEIPTARIKVWQTIELNKTIFVWYHSDSSSPHWDPIEIQEIERNVWRYEGRTEHIVNCHFQEIPENGADGQHIQELHTPAVMSGNVLNKSTFYDLLCKVLKHEWESKWWPSATSPHISQMSLNVKNKLFGYTLLEIEFTIRQIGAAFVVLQYKTVDFGGISGAFIQSITPLAPNRNRIVHQIYSEATLWGKLLAKFLLYGELRMIERDIIIWNNKKFIKNPILTKKERSLVRFRRWFNQFYSQTHLKPTQDMFNNNNMPFN